MCLRKENSIFCSSYLKKRLYYTKICEKVIYIAATAKLKKMEKEKNI